MTEDEALKIVLPLSRDDRKVLFQALLEEMHSMDLEEALNKLGYFS